MYRIKYQRKRGIKRALVMLLALVMLASVCFPAMWVSAEGASDVTVTKGNTASYTVEGLGDEGVNVTVPAESGLVVTLSGGTFTVDAADAVAGTYTVGYAYQDVEGADQGGSFTVTVAEAVNNVTPEQNEPDPDPEKPEGIPGGVDRSEKAKEFDGKIAALAEEVNSFAGTLEEYTALEAKVGQLKTDIEAASEELADGEKESLLTQTAALADALTAKKPEENKTPEDDEVSAVDALFERLMSASTLEELVEVLGSLDGTGLDLLNQFTAEQRASFDLRKQELGYAAPGAGTLVIEQGESKTINLPESWNGFVFKVKQGEDEVTDTAGITLTRELLEFDKATVKAQESTKPGTYTIVYGYYNFKGKETSDTKDISLDPVIIKVIKTFEGIDASQIPEGFSIDVTDGNNTHKLTMTEGNLTQTWTVEVSETGTYKVKENNAGIDGYKLSTSPEGITNGNGVDVSVSDAVVSFANIVRYNSCKNQDFYLDEDSMIVIQAHDNNIVLSRFVIGLSARQQLNDDILQEDSNYKNKPEHYYSSLDNYVGQTISVEGTDVTVTKEPDGRIKLHVGTKSEWTKAFTADYSYQNAAGDITITNTYTPTANLTIEKVVTGITLEEDAVFNMKVTYDGTYQEQFKTWAEKNNYNVENNSINVPVTVKAGASTKTVELKGLPYGTYTVQESVDQIYTPEDFEFDGVTYTVDEETTGSVVLGEVNKTYSIIVTNAYKPTTTDVIITKQVRGNMGDWSKDFSFTVVSDKPLGEDSGYTLSSDKKTANFTLRHDGTVTLKNVPIGASLTVTESNADDYTTTVQLYVDGQEISAEGIHITDDMRGKTIEIVVTNEKNATIDTGVATDSLPYILLMTLAVIGAGALLLNKRRVF